MTAYKPKVLDLFSGIGGFSLGLERAGMETAAFCEINPKCRALLKHHWPEVPSYDDVEKITGAGLDADGVDFDIMCAGFPCQDLSYAGKGAGLDGARSGLWFQIARTLRERRDLGKPVRFVILENVSALLARGLGVVLGDLASLGYDAWWDCIPASAVGAPHRRDRIWIVAYPRGEQYEGFCDALRRGIAKGLSQAFADSRIRAWDGGEADAFDPDADRAGPHREGMHLDGGPELRDQQVCDAEPFCGDVANTPSEQRDGRGVGTEPSGRDEPSDSGQDVADAGFFDAQGIIGECSDQEERSFSGKGPPRPRHAGIGGQWSVEPDVGRVAYGVSARVDRLHGLGNAVVPVIPEIIGRAIIAAEEEVMRGVFTPPA